MKTHICISESIRISIIIIMSRVGKLPVPIPSTVTIEVTKHWVSAKGPKGELKLRVPHRIEVVVADQQVTVERKKEFKRVRALHGTIRNLIANMVKGVVDGYEKRLELIGTGYRVKVAGQDLELSLGFSHPVVIKKIEGITFGVEGQNEVIITGIDKQLVGQTAATIRKLRPPEPYKGKGIRYKGEVIIKKAGKTGKGDAK